MKVYMAIQQCLLDIYFYTILSPSNHKSIKGGTNIKDSTDIKVGKKQLIVATNVLQNLLVLFNCLTQNRLVDLILFFSSK